MSFFMLNIYTNNEKGVNYMYGYGYGGFGGEWIWIAIVLFVLLFIVFGNNRGGCGCCNQHHNRCC